MNSQDGQLAVAVLVVVFYVVVGHSVEQVQKTGAARERGRFPIAIHESAPGILIGMAISLLCGYFYKSGPSFEFDEHVFFTFALPPIIFSTGFSLKKRNFFKYFGYILTFGLLGTLIQFMIIATMSYVAINKGFVQVQQDGVVVSFNLHECMILAAVLSASDEVAALSLIKQSEHPKLSAIMFGEGVLNDAMSVLFFRSVQRSEVSLAARALNFTTLGILLGQALYLCIMAAGLGIGVGLVFSRLLKVITSMQEHPVRQTAVVLLGGYLSFLLAESINMSGILTVFFTGLTLSHYAWHSLGNEAKTSTRTTVQTLSAIAEGYCFAGMGLSMQSFQSAQWSTDLILLSLGTLIIGRTMTIVFLSFAGWVVFRRKFCLSAGEQLILCMGGIVRGAICWAQVQQVHDRHRGIMITTTVSVVMVTVVLFSVLIPTTLMYLELESSTAGKRDLSATIAPDELHELTLEQSLGPAYGAVSPVANLPDSEWLRMASRPGLLRRVSEDLHEDTYLHRAWRAFDGKFLRPVFCADADPSIAGDAGGPNGFTVENRIPMYGELNRKPQDEEEKVASRL